MSRIIAYLLEKIGVGIAFRAIYFSFLLLVFGAWFGFVVYFLGLAGDLYNWINQALQMFSTGGGSEILGLLTCLGVVDGINAGLPIFLTVLSSIVIINISKYFYNFASSLLSHIGNIL